MSWDTIGALGALVALQGINVAVVRGIVRAEVAKLNGTYIRREFRETCDQRHEDLGRRVGQLETESREQSREG